jgi:hypothetical protein
VHNAYWHFISIGLLEVKHFSPKTRSYTCVTQSYNVLRNSWHHNDVVVCNSKMCKNIIRGKILFHKHKIAIVKSFIFQYSFLVFISLSHISNQLCSSKQGTSHILTENKCVCVTQTNIRSRNASFTKP